ncbi:MAG TPA: dihydrodipicolinate synthase family protein [Candidatus Latescibacteria bacterium]|jgi:4-hydroxy-tetrahydrodipicolinate synthase|nr:dihydrodipicolinate synthase family protein [Candidatus Latescibacterota bacterium]HJP33372.1 dihydrodipicolinate synthase family protein [Candidatus Latescibacterota bacterium]
MTETWRGIFPILITPFTDDLQLDEASLRRQVDFCLEAGATGVVGPANASEFSTLSDDERRRWIEIVVEQVDRRVPVVASVTSGHARAAAALAGSAQAVGVDGIMSMPPPILKPDVAGCVEYFRFLAGAVEIPVILQNYAAPLGTPMPAAVLARLCCEVGNIEYIKEEVPPEPRMISATLAAVGDACKGIFGGQGGIYLIDEYRRGAVGNMPGAHTTDVLVDLWKRLEAGDLEGTREMFHQLLPLMVFERLYGVAVYKEVLKRRGIFTSSAQRAPGAGLDDDDYRELDPALEQVESLFRIQI